MRTSGMALLACGMLIAADGTATAGDPEALRGTWAQTAFVMNGRARDAAGTSIVVDGDTITVRHGAEAESPSPYTLDPARKAIDLKLENEGRTLRGIYKLEGRTLTFCFHPESRPTTFAAGPGTGAILMAFGRR